MTIQTTFFQFKSGLGARSLGRSSIGGEKSLSTKPNLSPTARQHRNSKNSIILHHRHSNPHQSRGMSGIHIGGHRRSLVNPRNAMKPLDGGTYNSKKEKGRPGSAGGGQSSNLFDFDLVTNYPREHSTFLVRAKNEWITLDSPNYA